MAYRALGFVLGCCGLLACGTSGARRSQVSAAPPPPTTDFPADVDLPSSKRGVIVPGDVPIQASSPTLSPTETNSSPSSPRNPLGSP